MFIDLIPASWLCTGFVLIFVVCTQAGLFFFNLWYKKKQYPENNEVGGLMFGTQSLIYSLILAFVIVAVWTDYEQLNQTIELEADKLNGILSHSANLPDNIRNPLNHAIYNYCNQIITKEWQMKEKDSIFHPSAIPSLRMMLLRTQPRNKTEENIFNVIDENLSSVSDLRRDRLDHTHSHVPPLVWLILKAGSVLMIIFSYFLNAPSSQLKRIYLFFISSTIAMCLFLVYTLDHPYNGSTQVSKTPYERILIELDAQHNFTNN